MVTDGGGSHQLAKGELPEDHQQNLDQEAFVIFERSELNQTTYLVRQAFDERFISTTDFFTLVYFHFWSRVVAVP